MSILGVVLRVRLDHVAQVAEKLAGMPGVDTVANRGDGRIALVIEDTGESDVPTAAATLGAMSAWPEVLNASLVYEYSGPDAPAPEAAVPAFQAWRDQLSDISAAGRVADAANH
jgi:periplasmic nitrate reductase NapD